MYNEGILNVIGMIEQVNVLRTDFEMREVAVRVRRVEEKAEWVSPKKQEQFPEPFAVRTGWIADSAYLSNHSLANPSSQVRQEIDALLGSLSHYPGMKHYCRDYTGSTIKLSMGELRITRHCTIIMPAISTPPLSP